MSRRALLLAAFGVLWVVLLVVTPSWGFDECKTAGGLCSDTLCGLVSGASCPRTDANFCNCVWPSGGCSDSESDSPRGPIQFNKVEEGAGGFWGVGTSYAVTPDDDLETFSIENENSFGALTDNGLEIVDAGGIVQIEANSNSNLRTLNIKEFTVTVKSFEHSALLGNETGDNIITLPEGYEVKGVVNINTGAFSIGQVHAHLKNDYFDAVPMQFAISGSINSSTGKGTFEVHGRAFDDEED